ncbi:glycosyltransferase family A protein [Formosa sp. S-31]|uniref:glycosyltransferase family A protein n=1 Tax=Formosa sp. S-31 TaxID=2790949 RepID=UPI003EB9D674
MRKGVNPNKNRTLEAFEYIHQVVLPVYIPNQEGYFKDALKILQCCLESLFKTIHKKTFITVVNNGSCMDVTKYLQELYSKGLIQELIHTGNIGKINAINKGLSGARIELITIADADVLFLNDWQTETIRIFNNFPKAGVVGIVPQFKMYADLCSNLLFEHFFSKKLTFTKVVNPESMQHFYKSIGWDNNYNQDFLKVKLSIENKLGFKAIVGSGHFVATYRYSALAKRPVEVTNKKMGMMLRKYFDEPVLKIGGWRLTTENNYAYHMGNVHEPWMDEVFDNLKQFEGEMLSYTYKPLTTSYLSYFMKNHLFRKLMENKKFINWFIKFKGLPKEMTKRRWHY